MLSILLFRLGGLGDLLVAFPSIYLVRRKLSPCSVTLVCRKEYGQILKETGIVDTLVSLDESIFVPLFADNPLPDKDFLRWLRKFSFVLGWMQKRSSLRIKKYCPSSVKRKCCFFSLDSDSPGPISQFFFYKTAEFLSEERDPLPPFSEHLFLPLSPGQKEEGLNLLEERDLKKEKRFVVVHPGSGSETKCWPIESFLKIINRFAHKGIRGVLVTGMSEGKVEKEIRKETLPQSWTWLKSPPLLKLSGLLSSSTFYLGNDSGITHLAAACGTKGVALFRKDLKAAWKPYGRISVLASNLLSEVKVDSVWETISKVFLS